MSFLGPFGPEFPRLEIIPPVAKFTTVQVLSTDTVVVQDSPNFMANHHPPTCKSAMRCRSTERSSGIVL